MGEKREPGRGQPWHDCLVPWKTAPEGSLTENTVCEGIHVFNGQSYPPERTKDQSPLLILLVFLICVTLSLLTLGHVNQTGLLSLVC